MPYEIVPVNFLTGEHKSPAHLEKQPFGQVPYIDDDGFIVYESRAISRYIATKYASQGTPGLIPTELQAVAIFEQAASIEVNDFEPYAGGICLEKIFKPKRGVKTDEARAAELAATLESKLEGYERILSKQKYLAGDNVTLADLFHLPYGNSITVLGYGHLSKTPNVARWWKDISSRASWQSVKDSA